MEAPLAHLQDVSPAAYKGVSSALLRLRRTSAVGATQLSPRLRE